MYEDFSKRTGQAAYGIVAGHGVIPNVNMVYKAEWIANAQDTIGDRILPIYVGVNSRVRLTRATDGVPYKSSFSKVSTYIFWEVLRMRECDSNSERSTFAISDKGIMARGASFCEMKLGLWISGFETKVYAPQIYATPDAGLSGQAISGRPNLGDATRVLSRGQDPVLVSPAKRQDHSLPPPRYASPPPPSSKAVVLCIGDSNRVSVIE